MKLYTENKHLMGVLSGFLCILFCFPVSTMALDGKYAAKSKNKSVAVASVNPLATNIGLEMAALGGNAVDAAVATAFALGVVDSHNSGIGGGCFILARLESGQILALDGREMAPARAHRDMYLRKGVADSSLSKTGALAIGVPGAVAALFELHKQAGRLPIEKILAPSIRLAEEGFAVDAVFASRLARTESAMRLFSETKNIFLPGGKLLKAGDVLVQKDLAETYRKLSKLGPDYFYRGKFAKQLANWMAQNKGLVNEKDMAAYTVKYREPIQSQFLGYTVLGFPSPSSGGLHVSQILTMLEMQSAQKMKEVDRFHTLIETNKLAFADRAHWMGDADFVPVPKALLEAQYLRDRTKNITKLANSDIQHGLPPNYEEDIFNKHTTHIAAADTKGNWLAITTTLNTSFGSKVTIPGTGVLMNNQMDDFSAQPGVPNAFGLIGSEANAIAPGKRPLSSMSPSLVLKEGRPILTVGAAGGPTIISRVAQLIFNHLALDMPLGEAMRAPKIHHQWRPNRVFLDGFNGVITKDLEVKGHQTMVWPGFGSTQAVSMLSGELDAEAEPRIQE